MTSKLTLTVEKKIIRRAKSYAHNNGRSLSKLVERYLKSLIEPETEKSEIPEDLKKLYGAVKIPVNLDHKKEIRLILSSKNK